MVDNLKTMQVVAEQLNFRKGASPRDFIMRVLQKGDKIDVVEELGNGWSKVVLNGHNRLMRREGYVVSQYIKEVQ